MICGKGEIYLRGEVSQRRGGSAREIKICLHDCKGRVNLNVFKKKPKRFSEVFERAKEEKFETI